MNAVLPASMSNLWFIAGWTMIHFLWLGAIVAAVALACRMLLRCPSANVRYTVALASLILLAALPVVTAAWLMKYSPPTVPLPDIPSNTLSAAPGSAGGLVETLPQNNFVAPAPALEYPLQSRGLTNGTFAVAPTKLSDVLNGCISYLPWLWLIGTPLTFVLLVSGLVGTRRLSRISQTIEDDPILDLLAHLAASLRISRRVTVAVCDRIASPVLIGIVRPMILLPPAAITGWSPDEIEMVLLHELAHVRRWDNLINLLQRCLESLLFFHPAVWFISAWVRHERESCCDATVVSRTNRPHAYAELLVALAAQLPRSVLFYPAASSAMAAGPLRSRIRRILKLEDDPMLISGKSLAFMLTGVITAAALAVLYLPTIGHTEPSTAGDAEKQQAKSESTDLEVPQKPDFTLLRFELKRSKSGGAELYLNDRPIDPNEVAKSLPSQKELAGDQYQVSVKAETGVAYAEVMKLVNSLENAGLKKLALDTRGLANAHSTADGGELNRDLKLNESATKSSEQSTSEFPYIVQFEKGASKFLDGDEITIDEIRGTAKTFEPGNDYRIKGKYKLHSHPGAQLAAHTTAKEAKDGTSSDQSNQTQNISHGEAEFTLILPMRVHGWPHLSFYPLVSGEDFGGVYFGTGDTVLKEWWGSEKPAKDESKPQSGEYPYQVQFEKGASKFLDGDDITINEIRGTAKEITPGNNYLIKGKYKLHSHPSASLSAFTTAKEAKDGTGPVQSIQTKNISHGDADFTIVLPMTVRGWPHLSFYAGGGDIGGVYFGTGDSVLKEWWGSEKSHNHAANSAAASTQSQTPTVQATPNSGITITADQIEFNNGQLRASGLIAADQAASNSSDAPKKGSTKFPSLEDQKLADLAYKRLGLELESIGETDLKRVKALGYEGGVKVASGSAGSSGIETSTIRPNDILVGLHAWPTTNMKEVADVLARDDLDELTPLKFYAVRHVGGGAAYTPTGEAPEKDVVNTGRINVGTGGGYGGFGSSAPANRPINNTAKPRDPFNAAIPQLPTSNSPSQPQPSPAQPFFNDFSAARNPAILAESAKRLEEALRRKSEAMDRRLKADGGEATEKANRALDAANKQLEEAKRRFEEANRQQSQSSAQPTVDPYAGVTLHSRTTPEGSTVIETYTSGQQPPLPVPVLASSPYALPPVPNRQAQSQQQQAWQDANPYATPAAAPASAPVIAPAASAAVPNATRSASANNLFESAKRLEDAMQRKNEAMEKRLAAKTDQEIEKSKRDLDATNKQLDEAKRQLEDARRQQGKLDIEIKSFDYQRTNPQAGKPTTSLQPAWPAAPSADRNWPQPTPTQVLAAPAPVSSSPTAAAKNDATLLTTPQPHPYDIAEVPTSPGLDISSLDGTVTHTAIVKRTAPDGRPIYETIAAAGQITAPDSPANGDRELKVRVSSAKPNLRYDGKTFNEWQSSWLSGNQELAQYLKTLNALEAFAGAGLEREANPLIERGLYVEDERIQQRAREYLHSLSKTDAEPIVADLLSVLQNDLSTARRIEALRGLAAIGPNAESALPALKEALAKKTPKESIAAATAIKMIVGKDQYQKPIADVLGEELGIKVEKTPDGKWAALPLDVKVDPTPSAEEVKLDVGVAFNDFTNNVIEEQELLYSKEYNKQPK